MTLAFLSSRDGWAVLNLEVGPRDFTSRQGWSQSCETGTRDRKRNFNNFALQLDINARHVKEKMYIVFCIIYTYVVK